MRFFTTLYLLLLSYIIAALLFWGFSLHRQSMQLYDQDLTGVREHVDSMRHPAEFREQMSYYQKKKKTRTQQYIGEGSTFLLVILIGAAVVYNSFRRSLRLSRQQQNFMLSVTHELKSPIAGIKLNLQTLQKYQLDEDKKAKLLERSIIESDRLNDLCNNMLIASQMEEHQYKSDDTPLDLSELVKRLAHAYAARYPGRFECHIEAGHDFSGDELLLQMAVNNLLENAVKYAASSTEPVQVHFFRKEGALLLQVCDRGPGVRDEERHKIFEKFYRSGDERTRKTKGTGLGLYLTRIIVQQFRGAISVRNNPGGGALFEIRLPVG